MNNRRTSGLTQTEDKQPRVAAASDAVKPRRIYIDCTETYLSGLNTGIQRVARNIAARAQMLSDYFGIPCKAVVARNGRAVPVEMSLSVNRRHSRARTIMDKGRVLWGWVSPWVGRFRPLVRHMAWTVFHGWLGGGVVNTAQSISLGSGDLLMIADSFWITGRSEALVRSAKANDARVVLVVFDVIPITYPQLCEAGADVFRERLLRLLPMVDGVIAISRDVQSQLKQFLVEIGARVPPMEYAYLGADFSTIALQRGAVRKALLELCESGMFYAMVGTIEPRKGHLTVLRAFEQLWDAGWQQKLIIVGRLGWQCDEIRHTLKHSSYHNQRLFVLHDVGDMELEYLYQLSRGLIFASAVEGFGLPLVEAMSRGVPVIASDIPVFREIGQDYPVYFQVGNSMALAEAVRATDDRPRLAGREWVSWGTAAQDYLARAIKIFGDVS